MVKKKFNSTLKIHCPEMVKHTIMPSCSTKRKLQQGADMLKYTIFLSEFLYFLLTIK